MWVMSLNPQASEKKYTLTVYKKRHARNTVNRKIKLDYYRGIDTFKVR